MTSLDGIYLFVQAAETGSFAGAAQRLGLTSSAISKAVSRLETRLGVQLMRRTTRSLTLTDDGRVLFERCRSAFEEIEAAEDLLAQGRSELRGRLRISAPVVFAYRKLAPIVAAFAADHPAVEAELISTDSFSDLVDDRLDVLIRTGDLEDTSFMARKLCDTRFVTCASPSYLKAHSRPRSLVELENHACLRFVFPRTGRTFAWPYKVDGQSVTHEPNSRLRFTNADAMIAASIAGAGLVHIQSYMVEEHLASTRLVTVLDQFQQDGGPVSALYLPNRHLNPTIRAFVDLCALRLGTKG